MNEEWVSEYRLLLAVCRLHSVSAIFERKFEVNGGANDSTETARTIPIHSGHSIGSQPTCIRPAVLLVETTDH